MRANDRPYLRIRPTFTSTVTFYYLSFLQVASVMATCGMTRLRQEFLCLLSNHFKSYCEAIVAMGKPLYPIESLMLADVDLDALQKHIKMNLVCRERHHHDQNENYKS